LTSLKDGVYLIAWYLLISLYHIGLYQKIGMDI
jgi:hypothetical protein